ncbi:1-phosphofructokinase family hexose kinase [Pseudarthrobacter sp. NBSH8]|uniref:1-phosphofructokinase family hexose kinase n=1 Tax=Pseudarthrobacter sp. NBSH8 TaxID=2596911 RepID=UPI001628AAB0|nr:hexose kinase [Pseudarthrobacter sp. NBSH8]QNE13312.1 hexose kinase [Pseudarthrobacter sp. NBSH8]
MSTPAGESAGNGRRIITVTPNPAVDLTYHVDGIIPGGSHRVDTPLSRAGGKGLNVARVAHQLGSTVLAIAPAGGAAGAAFAAELAASGVPHRLIPVRAETRRSIALVDDVSGHTSIFNESGLPLEPAEWQALAAVVVESLSGDDGHLAGVLVGSGSLPAGAPQDFYSALVKLAHDAGVPAIIDTSGPGIIAAARAGADLLKPNNHELTEAMGQQDLAGAALQLIGLGARRVLVSTGADGMMAFDAAEPDRYWHARLPEPLNGNPTGAGDAAVSAAAVALANGVTDTEQILRAATAWSAAAVLMPGAGEISPRYSELADQLIVSYKELP